MPTPVPSGTSCCSVLLGTSTRESEKPLTDAVSKDGVASGPGLTHPAVAEVRAPEENFSSQVALEGATTGVDTTGIVEVGSILIYSREGR